MFTFELQVTNVRLPDRVVSDLDKLAAKHGINRSELIRQAVMIYLHITDNVGTILRPIAFQIKPDQIDYSHRGDVTIMKVPTGHAIVVGSTSSGGIGAKSRDEVKVAGPVLGKFLARVALMDIAAVGASPILLSATLGVEREPAGREIIEGIRTEIRILGLDPNQVIMENTEDNISTVQTGAGLTVIGFANEDDLRLGRSRPKDKIVAIGKPKIGQEVIPAETRGQIADLSDVVLVTQKRFAHDIVPVGTFGIEYEAKMIAHSIGRQVRIEENTEVDVKKSAGPATVVLVTIDEEKINNLRTSLSKPVNIVGEIM